MSKLYITVREVSGGRSRTLNIIDEYSREYLAIRVDRKLNSSNVIDALSDLFILHGVPLLSNYRSEELPVWAIYPQARHRNPRVKLAIDALCGNFNNFIIDPGYTLTPQTLKKLELND